VAATWLYRNGGLLWRAAGQGTALCATFASACMWGCACRARIVPHVLMKAVSSRDGRCILSSGLAWAGDRGALMVLCCPAPDHVITVRQLMRLHCRAPQGDHSSTV